VRAVSDFVLAAHSHFVKTHKDHILHFRNMFCVLLQDPDLHLKHLKPSPPASSIVNRCIECGFCESNCPSRDITLTPRQRITTYREISRLRDVDQRTAAQQQRLNDFEQSYEYDGDATCAADGMCQVKCPVKINTGELIKQLRSDELEGGEHPRATKAAMVSFQTLVTNSLDCHYLQHQPRDYSIWCGL